MTKQEKLEYQRKWVAANRERHNENCRRWKRKHRAQLRTAHKLWYYGPAGRDYLRRTALKRRKQHLRRWALNPEKYIEMSRRWNAEHGKAYKKKWNAAHRDKTRLHTKAWYQKNKHKDAAAKLVSRAVKKGMLVKTPCEKCGSKKDVRAAHNDYSNPLDINWLCKKHHMERYRRLPTLKERAAALAKSI